MHRFHLLLIAALLLASVRPAAAAGPLDWPVEQGRFYTQAAGAAGVGYVVSDADGAPFLTALKANGGPSALGYPISRRFQWGGTTVQAFQKAVLQWLPSENRVAFLNVFDDLSKAGRDDWLLTVRSTPTQDWLDNESQLGWDQIVKGRLAFLDANPAIRARYFSVPDPLTLYGLPASHVEDMGNHYAVRLQRAVIQQWKVEVPWAKAGEVTVANGGDIAKESGMFPQPALQPTDPSGTSSATAGPIPPGALVSAAPSVTPAAGSTVPPGDLVAWPTPTGTGALPAPPGSAPPLPPVPPAFRDPPIAQLPRAGAASRVVLDPGHGGGQVGASAQLPDGRVLREKELTLEVARRVAELLRAAGYQVTLTREADQQVGGPKLVDDLQARIDLANAVKADVFVSIHFNGIGNRELRGLEVYYATERPFSAENRALADLLYQQLGRQMAAAGYDAYPRGTRADSLAAGQGEHFFVLSPQTSKVKRPSLMPAALGEGLFLTNPQDAAQLDRSELRDAIARGYAAAIGTFLAGRRPWFP
ncbi:MAG TPA: N-acetylmuramoyl-L-alanine amidase [Chloroflexota bacterium]|jgi:N-acetylmuramoyl-L-alanine amidase